jgi:hypothetical protein
MHPSRSVFEAYSRVCTIFYDGFHLHKIDCKRQCTHEEFGMLVLRNATECGQPARAAVLADDMAVATAHDSLGIRVQRYLYIELHANFWGSDHSTLIKTRGFFLLDGAGGSRGLQVSLQGLFFPVFQFSFGCVF